MYKKYNKYNKYPNKLDATSSLFFAKIFYRPSNSKLRQLKKALFFLENEYKKIIFYTNTHTYTRINTRVLLFLLKIGRVDRKMMYVYRYIDW